MSRLPSSQVLQVLILLIIIHRSHIVYSPPSPAYTSGTSRFELCATRGGTVRHYPLRRNVRGYPVRYVLRLKFKK